MKYIFWISWIINAGVAIWWVMSDLNLEYRSPNPYSYFFLLYVIATLMIFLLSKYQKWALIMSLIPTIPMLVMMLIFVIVTVTGGRWN